MKGIYSLGLVGVEVEIISDEHVKYKRIGLEIKEKTHKAKIYFNKKGEAFFNSIFGRIYLNECVRV